MSIEILGHKVIDDLVLPVYSGEIVLSGDELFRQSAPDTRTVKGTKMVRILNLFTPGSFSLRDVLETAESEFNTVARQCGAKIVDHTWGLSRYEELRPRVQEDIICDANLVPEEFVLVASVNVINTRDKPPEICDYIDEIAWNYMNEGGLLKDMCASQFSIGVEQGTAYQGLILHDIDPWLPRIPAPDSVIPN